jgi:CRISPR-associated protein Csb1
MPHRHIFSIPLVPVTGDRFQPTGFPDLGTATFDKFDRDTNDWVKSLVVESEQSMANHLESVGWDSGNQKPVADLQSIPYVRVQSTDGDYLTSSRTEAHRLSSAFIREATNAQGTNMVEYFKEAMKLKDDRPLSARHIAATILALDPLSLIHGVFFADNKLPGQPKVTRALTSFVEAIDVRAAEYGGVKKDDVSHDSKTEGQGSKEGFGSIPFHRTLWTARSIIASFVIDLDQLQSYGLSEKATRLLEVIALWEIRTLLDGGLRLRTMCDLVPLNNEVSGLPSATDLSAELRQLSKEIAGEMNGGEAMTVVWGGKKKKEKKATEDGEDS